MVRQRLESKDQDIEMFPVHHIQVEWFFPNSTEQVLLEKLIVAQLVETLSAF
jgi:hypothetical protein